MLGSLVSMSFGGVLVVGHGDVEEEPEVGRWRQIKLKDLVAQTALCAAERHALKHRIGLRPRDFKCFGSITDSCVSMFRADNFGCLLWTCLRVAILGDVG